MVEKYRETSACGASVGVRWNLRVIIAHKNILMSIKGTFFIITSEKSVKIMETFVLLKLVFFDFENRL